MYRDLIRDLLAETDIEWVIGRLGSIAELDRYQGSLGLVRAAELVAEEAERIGLRDVVLRHYPADGKAQWWSFQAPMAWTPTRAELHVTVSGSTAFTLDHAASPMAVATYAAPRTARAVPLVRFLPNTPSSELAGALVVVDREWFYRGDLLDQLTAAGAIGFVTDAPARENFRGRIELPINTGLTAFSLTGTEQRTAIEAARLGGEATIVVEIDRSATMPVVEALLPGAEPDEVWLTGHLCHPRPGADDNASGAAALLGVARLLAEGRRRPACSTRFIWGPEYLGNAAVLHKRIHTGRGRLPKALVNLDMVGADQTKCRAPFVLERPPDCHPTLLGVIAERMVAETFRQTSAAPGVWQAQPFYGFSDHALYADPSIRRPAVQLCHPADRYNHSAGDTLEQISETEMLRSIVTAAAIVTIVGDLPGGQRSMSSMVEEWIRAETDAISAMSTTAPAEWLAGLRRHHDWLARSLRALAAGATEAEVADANPIAPLGAEPALSRRWSGPLNLRAMMAALPHAEQAKLREMIAEDKLCLAWLFNFAIRADGRLGRTAIQTHTAYSLRKTISANKASPLWEALLRSGWLSYAE